MVRDVSSAPIVKLTEQSAAAWRGVRGVAFSGATTLETGNTLYRFEDGVFFGRAPTCSNVDVAAWVSPIPLREAELIGFFADEGGFWSFSTKWRKGALAVILTKEKTFTLTSAVRSCRIERPSKPMRAAPSSSDVFDIPRPRSLAVRRPAPPSMTRIQVMPARAG